MDNIRGYNSSEINSVENGKDISEYIIDDLASFANLKLELRKMFSDNLLISGFLDMGRVAPRIINFDDLRSSVGLSLKFLTPVGTLNFDYGVKLEREVVNGEKEQFGRFHLLVGYF